MSKPLRLMRTPEPVAVADRGRLLDAAEVADAVFAHKVSRKWVLANVPPQYRHKIGRGFLYYENEVRAWADTRRVA